MVWVSAPLNVSFQTAVLPKFEFIPRSQEKHPEWTHRDGESFEKPMGQSVLKGDPELGGKAASEASVPLPGALLSPDPPRIRRVSSPGAFRSLHGPLVTDSLPA